MAIASTRERPACVAFTGGGTAGHVFPGLAVAESLASRWRGRIVWIGCRSGPERGLADAAGIPFIAVPAGKLRRYWSLRNLTDIVLIIAGFFASLRVLARERPRLVFSKGGFVTVPPVAAARLLGIPAFTHESDADPGLATRINARFCERVLVSHADTVACFPAGQRARVTVTGNPVRPAMLRGDPRQGRRWAGCGETTPLVVALGGSLGSAYLNRTVAAAVPRLPGVRLVHQVGSAAAAPAVAAGYSTHAFLGEELPHLLAAADLVVCRAGANTLAELAALGKPSVLVPLPAAGSRGDQLRNAERFRRAGAAVVLREEETGPQELAAAVLGLLADAERRAAMARAARSLDFRDSAATIAGLIAERIA